jgi:hypothetical protein
MGRTRKKGPRERAFADNLAPQLFTALAANSGYPLAPFYASSVPMQNRATAERF